MSCPSIAECNTPRWPPYPLSPLYSALDVADEQPEGTIFLIPAKLEECETPGRLRRWHWVNLFEEGGYERLVAALAEFGGGGACCRSIGGFGTRLIASMAIALSSAQLQ